MYLSFKSICNYYYRTRYPRSAFRPCFHRSLSISLFFNCLLLFHLRINSFPRIIFSPLLSRTTPSEGRRWWIDERASIDLSRPDHVRRRDRETHYSQNFVWALVVNRETTTFRFSSLRVGVVEKKGGRKREIEKKSNVSQGKAPPPNFPSRRHSVERRPPLAPRR